MGVKEALLSLDERNIPVPGSDAAMLESDLLDVRQRCSLEAVGDDCLLFPIELNDPEFNPQAGVLRVCHERHEPGDFEVLVAWKRRTAVLCGVIVKKDQRLTGSDD